MNEENNQNNQFNNIGIGMEPQPLGDLTNEPNNLNSEPPQKEKKKGRLKLIILIVASAIIAISAGYFAYTTLFNTPYNTYKNAISMVFDNINNTIKESEDIIDYDLNEDILKNSGTFKLTSNVDELNDLTKYSYNYETMLDIKNEKLKLGLDIINGKESLVQFLIYAIKDKGYIKADEIFDKIIEFESDMDFNIEEDTVIEDEDITFLLNKLKEYIINSLDDKKITKEKETINVNDKKISVINNKYIIDEEEYNKIIDSILTSMLNDNEFLDKCAKIFNVSKDDMKDALESLLETTKLLDNTITFNIYATTITNRIIGVYITLEDLNIKYTDYKDIINIILTDDDESENITIKNENNKWNISYTSNGNKLLEADITTKDKETTINFNINEVDGNIVFKELEANKTKYSFSLKADLTDSYSNFGLELTNNTEVVSKFDDIDTSNSIKEDDLTDEDLETILNNIDEKLKDTPFYTVFEIFLGSSSSNKIVDFSNKKVMLTTADTVIDAAKSYYTINDTTYGNMLPKNEGETACVTIDDLYYDNYLDIDTFDYSGKVVVQKLNNEYIYYLYLLKDYKYMINGKTGELTSNDIEEYNYYEASDIYYCNNY